LETISTFHFINSINSRDTNKLIYLLNLNALCISPKVLDAARKSPAIHGIIKSYLKEPSHLSRAAERGLNDCVKLSLEHGADPNSQDKYGRTALHYAASIGCPEVIRTLLDNKADPHIGDAYGITPLICALESECEESQDLLWAVIKTKELFTNPNLTVKALTREKYHKELEEGPNLRDSQVPVPTVDVTPPFAFLPPQRKNQRAQRQQKGHYI